VTKILAKKIVSIKTIFFSKIVYLYRFKRYIFEYRCPSLALGVHYLWMSLSPSILSEEFPQGARPIVEPGTHKEIFTFNNV
jgi:hypothetical protein